MKSICMTAVFLIMVLLTACQGLAEKKNVQSNETTSSTLRLSNTDQQKYQETSGETVQGIERWWLKRNENHQTPEVSDYIDLSKYDAYYVNPKCKKKKIFLTFDCGYENGFTPKILDVLKKQKIVAAFFVTKPFIREGRELVRRMKKEGHIVGNHTVHHKSMPTLSDRDNKQEIIDCAEYCKEATGYEMDHFIRPPMGEYNEKTLKLTKSMGYKTIFWSMAYVDFDVNKQPGKQYVVEHFKKYTHNGAIPLMHNVSQSNAEALDEVITNLKKEGYQFESLKKLSSY
ncbi:polysaccharide deacetylase family protein [Anaerostipes amylophilus]|uniref:Polysaccharide deacetylase family protein n=1 Tax=Anaerostipes amylophilus TaxID=2981779 RepID=A0ABV1IX02_9FIRM